MVIERPHSKQTHRIRTAEGKRYQGEKTVQDSTRERTKKKAAKEVKMGQGEGETI